MAASYRLTEWTVLADEVFLADKLIEGTRAHPGGQRLSLGWWLEERLRTGAGQPLRRTRGSHEGQV